MNKSIVPQLFTYDWYRFLIDTLINSGYTNVNYAEKPCDNLSFILRHDIDNSIPKALEIAKIENELNVKSTFFVLLTSDFYNIASKKNHTLLREIVSLGHTLGLHFDEVAYRGSNNVGSIDTPSLIVRECNIMSSILDIPITAVSMHRPSKETLQADYHIPGIINSYSNHFFNEFKYLSDSRCRWREPIIDIIKNRQCNNLHILTHPIWYNQNYTEMGTILDEFISRATEERFITEKENITDLESILK